MKYIKNYEAHNEMIIEKITYREVLFYLSLLYLGSHGYNFYKNTKDMREISKVYNVVNLTDNYPTGREKFIIDSVRYQVINQVKNSELFIKFGKNREYIVDSLETVTIKFIKPTGDLIFKKTNVAMFIKLGELEEIAKNNFKDKALYSFFDMKSSKKNVILINQDHLYDDDLPEILVHEIYHYVDKLLGDSKELSTMLGLSKFVDTGIINKEYLNYKASLMFNLNNKNSDKYDYLKALIHDIADDTVDNFEYLASDNEIFARWKSFKGKLVKFGYINKLEDSISTYDVSKYVKDEKVNLMDLDILLIIDWEKMEELDNLIK